MDLQEEEDRQAEELETDEDAMSELCPEEIATRALQEVRS